MIIGISGKISSGKDIVGKIIQFLTANASLPKDMRYLSLEDMEKSADIYYTLWKIKKFADKLKDIVCLLLNCTREQLEDSEFKNKELGEEWWYYKTPSKSLLCYLDENQSNFIKKYELIKPTPRLLLQLLGTECGRNIIHPNIWVNALMNEYKTRTSVRGVILDMSSGSIQETGFKADIDDYPNWIITDMRFPNEMRAIKSRSDITIRVIRPIKIITPTGIEQYTHKEYLEKIGMVGSEHESEIALDDAEFDYTIYNNGNIEDLIKKVRQILILEKII